MAMDLIHATGQPVIRVAGDMEGLARVLADRLVNALQFRLKDEWVSVAHIVCGGATSATSATGTSDATRRTLARPA